MAKRFRLSDESEDTAREQRALQAATLDYPEDMEVPVVEVVTKKSPSLFFQTLEEPVEAVVLPPVVAKPKRLPWEKDEEIVEEAEDLVEEIEEEPEPEVVVDISELPNLEISESTVEVPVDLEVVDKFLTTQVEPEEEVEVVTALPDTPILKDDMEFTKVSTKAKKVNEVATKRQYKRKSKLDNLDPVVKAAVLQEELINNALDILSVSPAEALEVLTNAPVSAVSTNGKLPPNPEPPRSYATASLTDFSKLASLEKLMGLAISNGNGTTELPVPGKKETTVDTPALDRIAMAAERIASVVETWWAWVEKRDKWESAFINLVKENDPHEKLRPELAPVTELGKVEVDPGLQEAATSTPAQEELPAEPYFLARLRALCARHPQIQLPEPDQEGFVTVEGARLEVRDLLSDFGLQEHALQVAAQQGKLLPIKKFAKWLSQHYHNQKMYVHPEHLEALFRSSGVVNDLEYIDPQSAQYVVGTMYVSK